MNELPICYQVNFMLENIKIGISVWRRRSKDDDFYRYRKIYDYGMENYMNLKEILTSDKINEKDVEGKTVLHILLKFFDQSYHIKFPEAGCDIGEDIITLINNPKFNIKYEINGQDYLDYVQGLYFFQEYDEDIKSKNVLNLENRIIKSIAEKLDKIPMIEYLYYESD